MKKDYTHILFLLDKSGSMKHLQKDVIGQYNNFIEEQKKVKGEATTTLIQFDDKYEPNYVGYRLEDVPLLTMETYRPRGWTRLLDAMGRAIISTGEALSTLKEEAKPEKIIFAILTDGEENSSQEFTQKEIADLVKDQTDNYKWQFVFLGAKQDAVLTARKYNIDGANAMTFAASKGGLAAAASSLSKNVASYRTGSKVSMDFEKSDRDAQESFLKKDETGQPSDTQPKFGIRKNPRSVNKEESWRELAKK